MTGRFTREALLRQLLDADKSSADDKMIYSYLLGNRLFQSPEYLLKEIQARFGVKESAAVECHYIRRNRKLVSRLKSSPCAKSLTKRENPKVMSKSTSNMLEKNTSTLYSEMLCANVTMHATGRVLLDSDFDNTSPPSPACGVSTDTLAKSTDFSLDILGDTDAVDFDEENRRNTAPPAALQAFPPPQDLGKYTGLGSDRPLKLTSKAKTYVDQQDAAISAAFQTPSALKELSTPYLSNSPNHIGDVPFLPHEDISTLDFKAGEDFTTTEVENSPGFLGYKGFSTRRDTACVDFSTPKAKICTDYSAHKGFSTHRTSTGFVSTVSSVTKLEKLPETNIDDVLLGDSVAVREENTIRRRKKGRRRTTVTDLDLSAILQTDPAVELLKVSALGEADRDSGILSGVVDPEIEADFCNENNCNNARKGTTSDSNPMIPGSRKSRSDVPQDNKINGLGTSTSQATTETLPAFVKDFESQIHPCKESVKANDSHARQFHLLHVLLVWVRNFPADFASSDALATLKGLMAALERDCQELKDQCAKVLETLSAAKEARYSYKKHVLVGDAFARRNDFRVTKEAMIAMVTGMSDVGDACKMAEQLCLIEMDFLSSLGAEEFLQMLSSKGEKESDTGLGACVKWFNHLSHLVATSICLCRKPKHRRQVISLFTKAASRCYQLSNFNSAMAILTGLSLGAVARLKRTWSKVDTGEMRLLQSVFDPSSNFTRYRAVFKSRWVALRHHLGTGGVSKPPFIPDCIRHSSISQQSQLSMTSQHRDSGIECESESATSLKSSSSILSSMSSSSSSSKRKFTFDDVTPMTGIEDGVLVPFLTLMVKDVYFLNHSTRTVEQDGTINFEKLRHLGEILHPLETWKKNPCVYRKNDKIHNFLLRSSVLKDVELYILSYKREQPRNKFEKGQLKGIRIELESSKRDVNVRRMIARRKTM